MGKNCKKTKVKYFIPDEGMSFETRQQVEDYIKDNIVPGDVESIVVYEISKELKFKFTLEEVK